VPLADADAMTNLLMISRAGEANSCVANLSQMARAKALSWRQSGQKQRTVVQTRPKTRRKAS
jgi:hypothetical protein